ncbi:hypothetical protein JUJ52_08760 [Virgibacillus sp. AGTR]|uniref:hypothetical protein n=1 Tax=Virgibacillus sp. AGTR TaxID=2812055 RepID=UPI001D16EE29|nr:hypothetical protein [Virgibacillus sp. AGTR]MCC2250056.1 hypothetical protein [Virgibacillus sp. AGTR]
MKANINLEINKEDLNYELECLVSKVASEQVKKMVREQATDMVREEVEKIIAPIVDSYLKTAIVGEEYKPIHSDKPPRTEVDKYIKRTLQNYLDEPCFRYSNTASKLGEKYMPSSSGGTKTTRAEYWIMDKAREYADKELFSKIDSQIEETIKSVIPTGEQIQEMIKQEIQNKFNQKGVTSKEESV